MATSPSPFTSLLVVAPSLLIHLTPPHHVSLPSHHISPLPARHFSVISNLFTAILSPLVDMQPTTRLDGHVRSALSQQGRNRFVKANALYEIAATSCAVELCHYC
jgi:hypothetical protein